MAALDLRGQRFGRLTAIERAENRGHHVRWRCVCDCGGETVTATDNLTSRHTTSCGCHMREIARAKELRHGAWANGQRGTREWNSWAAAKGRCCNPNNAAFSDYGGRGITMCDRWRDSFEAFLADMGKCPPGLTLDRRDNDGPYSPENCRWATRREQATNYRRNVRYVVDGESLTLVEISERFGVNEATLRNRLYNMNWPIERAIDPTDHRAAHLSRRHATV